MNLPGPRGLWVLPLLFLLVGCVSRTYEPGAAGHPFNQLQLGQSYGDMVRVLGKPDHSRAEDRTGKETAALFIPGWSFVELAGDFNPSAAQYYTYDGLGTIVIANSEIRRIEAKKDSPGAKPGG